jgi:hypothetical protein
MALDGAHMMQEVVRSRRRFGAMEEEVGGWGSWVGKGGGSPAPSFFLKNENSVPFCGIFRWG